MRLLAFGCFLVSSAFAALPPELDAALKAFRADPPRDWSFTQTTRAQGESTIERCDATKAEFERWTLVQKNGRAPSAEETRVYTETRSRRSRTGTAPKITDQIDTTSIEKISETADRVIYRAKLAPGEKRDTTAASLRANLVVHKPTATLELFELASIAEFSPTLGVSVKEMKTTMTYALPTGEAPSLPQQVTTHVRGRAFFFKSLDADMTVTFTDYAKAPPKVRAP